MSEWFKIFRSWYSWFCLKKNELLAALDESVTARQRIVSVDHEGFMKTLKEAGFEDTKHYH